MEEIINETPETPVETPTENKLSWREFLETEKAVRVIYLIFGFLAILMVMTFLQTRTAAICCGDWDGYYHIKWSSLLWENFKQFKWLPTFEWLPLTVLNPKEYADHHFLFHLLQIPFLWFFEPTTAAKVSTVFFSTLAIFSVYWMLFRYEVKHQLVWLAAIMVSSNAFFYRMNMAKAPPLTIVITVLGIHLLIPAKIFVAAAADVCVCVDVQPVSAASVCGGYLDGYHRLERTAIRMAANCLHFFRHGSRKCDQSIFPSKSRPFL